MPLITSRQALMICLQQFHVPSPKQLYFSTCKKLWNLFVINYYQYHNHNIVNEINSNIWCWILTFLHWLLLRSTCFISSLISYHRPSLFCCNFKAQWWKMQPGPLTSFLYPFLSFHYCEILAIDCAGTWFSLVFLYMISWFWNVDSPAATQLLYIYLSMSSC